MFFLCVGVCVSVFSFLLSNILVHVYELHTGVGAISQAAACEGRLICNYMRYTGVGALLTGSSLRMSLANYHLNIIYIPSVHCLILHLM